MKLLKPIIGMLAFMLLSAPAWGATKYGDAVIEEGSMTVLRDGQRSVYTPADRDVTINHQDIIRLGNGSKVVLRTVEKATLTLGSNAVLHVEPWKRDEKKGAMRMLFGRFRAVVTGLSGAERFNVRTATATIGVKGTDLTGAQTAEEDTILYVADSAKQNPVDFTGLSGKDIEIPVGYASLVSGSGRPSHPIKATDDLKNELSKLDAPSPTSAEAGQLPAAAGAAGLKADSDTGDGESSSDLGRSQADSAKGQAAEAATEQFRTTIGVQFD